MVTKAPPKRVTATSYQDAQPVEVLAPGGELSGQLLPNGLTTSDRRKSLRAYRRDLDWTIAMAKKGRMSSRDALALANTIKIAAEILMSERLLQANGMEDMEPDAISGVDGGANFGEDTFTAPVVHRLTRKQGVGADGNIIDETTVEIEGGPEVTQNLALTKLED